jgi:hypothetical protein
MTTVGLLLDGGGWPMVFTTVNEAANYLTLRRVQKRCPGKRYTSLDWRPETKTRWRLWAYEERREVWEATFFTVRQVRPRTSGVEPLWHLTP